MPAAAVVTRVVVAACSRHLGLTLLRIPLTAVKAERALSSNVTNVVCCQNENKEHEMTVPSIRASDRPRVRTGRRSHVNGFQNRLAGFQKIETEKTGFEIVNGFGIPNTGRRN